MAYLLNEEENQQQQQQSLSQNQPQMPGMGGGGQNVLVRPSRMGTGFTNITQFLEANKQAGQQLTNRVVGNVQKDTSKAISGIQDVRQGVESTRQSKQEWETDAEGVRSAVEKAKDTSKAENLTDLESLVQGPKLSRTMNLMQGNTNVNELNEQFNKAVSNLGANLNVRGQNLENELGQEYGRMGLVRRAIKSPTYTAGQMALDQTIMEGVGSQDLQNSLIQNRAQIGQTRQEALNLTDEQKQLAGLFSDLAKQKAQELQQLQIDTTRFTNQQIDQQKAQAEAEIAEYEGLVKKILSGELSADQIYSILNPNYRPKSFQGISEKPTTGEIDPTWAKFLKTNVQLSENEVPRINLYTLSNPYNISQDRFISLLAGADINDPVSFYRIIKPNLSLYNTAKKNVEARVPNEIKIKKEQLQKELQEAFRRRWNWDTPTYEERNLQEQIEELNKQENEWIKKNMASEIKDLLSQTRAATAQDEVYRQAAVNKWLRENFGLDTSTRLFNLDPTSLAKVNREGLRDKVTTTNQVRLLNALERLMAGEAAKQLSLEERGKTALDIIDHGNFGQRTQNALGKEYQNVFSSMKDKTLYGRGLDAYDPSGPLDFSRGYASISTGINALDLLAKTDPETYKKIAGERAAGDYYYFDRNKQGTAGSWADAMARAREQAQHHFNELLTELGYNNRLQLGKKKG